MQYDPDLELCEAKGVNKRDEYEPAGHFNNASETMVTKFKNHPLEHVSLYVGSETKETKDPAYQDATEIGPQEEPIIWICVDQSSEINMANFWLVHAYETQKLRSNNSVNNGQAPSENVHKVKSVPLSGLKNVELKWLVDTYSNALQPYLRASVSFHVITQFIGDIVVLSRSQPHMMIIPPGAVNISVNHMSYGCLVAAVESSALQGVKRALHSTGRTSSSPPCSIDDEMVRDMCIDYMNTNDNVPFHWLKSSALTYLIHVLYNWIQSDPVRMSRDCVQDRNNQSLVQFRKKVEELLSKAKYDMELYQRIDASPRLKQALCERLRTVVNTFCPSAAVHLLAFPAQT